MSVTQTYRGKTDLSASGNVLELTYEGVTDPGNEIDLIDYTVPAGFKIVALQIYSSSRLESRLKALVDTAIIGSWRHGPGEINGHFTFSPYREIEENETIKIRCLAASYRPATDIEVFLQARVIPI